MMRKNKNLISKSLTLLGSMLRLRFFFSLLLLFLFSNLHAIENAVRIEVDSVDENNDIHENFIQSEMYVSAGTVIYGIDNISIKTTDSDIRQKNKATQKQISQKINNRTVIKKVVTRKNTEKKISQDQPVMNFLSHQSDHSFILTDHPSSTGITTNNTVKEVIISNLLYTNSFNLVNTNSSYSNSISLKGSCCAEFSLFTRPPPSFKSKSLNH